MVDAAVEAAREVDVVASSSDASERTGAGTDYLLDLLVRRNKPVVLVLNKIDLVAKHKLLPIDRLVPPAARVRRHRAGLGADRRRRRSPRTGAAVAPARERPAVSRTTTSRISRSGRWPPKWCASRCWRTRATSCRFRPRWSSISSRSRRRRAGCCGCTARSSSNRDVAEADRDRPRRRHDQADRHGRAAGARAVLRDARSFSIST